MAKGTTLTGKDGVKRYPRTVSALVYNNSTGRTVEQDLNAIGPKIDSRYDVFSLRATASYKNNTLTLGSGVLIFVEITGNIRSISHASSETFTFTQNATSFLLINNQGTCQIVSGSDLSNHAGEKILAMYDGSNNRLCGLLIDYINATHENLSRSSGFVTRAAITIDGNVLTLGAGLFYFLSNYGEFWQCSHASSETITFTQNATSFLFINKNGVCSVASTANLPSSSNEQLLAIYDGSNKKIVGPIRDFYNLSVTEQAEKIEYIAKDTVYHSNANVTSTSSEEIILLNSYTINRNYWYRFCLGSQDADKVIIRAYSSTDALLQTITFSSASGFFKLVEDGVATIKVSVVKRSQSESFTSNYLIIERANRDISLTKEIHLGNQVIEARSNKTHTIAYLKPISQLPDMSNDLYLSFVGSNVSRVQVIFYKGLGTDNIERATTNVEYSGKPVKISTLQNAEAYSIYVNSNEVAQVSLDYINIGVNNNVDLGDEIPSYFISEIEDCAEKIDEITEDAVVYTTAILADTHLIMNDDSRESIKTQNMVLERLHNSTRIDSITHLGDLIMANEWSRNIHSQGQAIAIMRNYMHALYTINAYLYATPGNHDGEYLQYFKDKAWDAIYKDLAIPNKLADDGTSYFAIDMNAQNLLCLYITNFDDVDGQTCAGFSTRLLQWMIDTITDAQSDRNILIFAHVPPYMASYITSSYLGVTTKGVMANRGVFEGICNAYNTHTTYTGTTYDSETLNCDFSSKTGKILCYIAGHVHGDSVRYPNDEWTADAHFNNETESWEYSNNMPCPVVTIASGNPWIQGSSAGYEGSVAPSKVVNSVTEESFDIMVYELGSTDLNFIRFGAGSDRVVDLTSVI